jgi:general secretion pathway protein C
MKHRLPALVNFLLVIAIAATATYWVLQLTARRTTPEPVVAVPAGDRVARSQPLDTTGIAGLFGSAGAGTAPARVRLAGVIAEGAKGSGVALLSLDGQPAIAYRAGESIDGQMTLAEVHADRVVIHTGAGVQDIRLPERPVSDGISPVR